MCVSFCITVKNSTIGLGGQIIFEVPDYTVIENNGTVTVCLSSNDSVTNDLTLEVAASMKQSSTSPASKLCVLYTLY